MPLALPDGADRQLSELLAQFAFRRGPGIGQPPAKRLGSAQALAIQDDAQARAQTDDARQALGAAPTRQQSQFHLRQTELRARFVEDEAIIAGQGELQAATEARAADGRDGRHRQTRELVEQFLSRRGDRRGAGGVLDGEELVQVGPGDEAALLAAADDEQRCPAGGDGVERRVEIGQHLAIEDVDGAARHVELEDYTAIGVALHDHGFGLEDLHGIISIQGDLTTEAQRHRENNKDLDNT